MSFIYNGIRVKKDLTEEERERLVEDTVQKRDANGVISVYRRLSLYDPKKRFNNYIASKKIGVLDEQTGKVIATPPKRKSRSEPDVSLTDALTEASENLTDNRQVGKVVYPLAPTLEIVLCTALGGDLGPKAVANYWNKFFKFFSERWGSELPKSAPSISTINRLFRLIDPTELQNLYQEFVFPLLPDPNVRDAEKAIYNVDGQAVRASRNDDSQPHQILSFYSTEAGLAFAQALIDKKSNEIPAAYRLIKLLDLHGAIVTGDAMHCQRKFVRAVMEDARADYCLALKSNQGNLAKSSKKLFEENSVTLFVETENKEHGRIERRRIEVLPASLLPKEILKDWYGLEMGCIVKQTSWRTVISNGGVAEPTTEATRYFISSLTSEEPNVANHLLHAIRSHWSIENKLHHVLDCDFGQDHSQMKNANLAANTVQMNKFALAIIELVRRIANKERKHARIITINEIRKSLINDPSLAISYINTFLRYSEAAELNRTPEPLIK